MEETRDLLTEPAVRSTIGKHMGKAPPAYYESSIGAEEAVIGERAPRALSAALAQVGRGPARSAGEEARKIYQELDSLNSQRPIDVIKQTRPDLIIDEPQKFGKKTETMIHEFNPLFILRYSTTHKNYHKIYRLDAIDAYNQKLVKKSTPNA